MIQKTHSKTETHGESRL